MKKNKGIALLLTLVIMIALAVMSLGLQSIIVASSKNNARSHILNVTYRVAEYGLENGRISLIQELNNVGTGIISNIKHLDLSVEENAHYEENELTRRCLALHGYNMTEEEIDDLNENHDDVIINDRFWYTRLSSKHPILTGHTAGLESFSTDPLFSDYQFEYFVQRIDIDEPIPGYNFIDKQTIGIRAQAEDLTNAEDQDDVDLLPKPEDEDMTDEEWEITKRTELEQWVYDQPRGNYGNERVFYRVISCGYSDPKKASNHIVPLQAYYSIGGSEEEEDINYIRNNLITEGFYRP